ALRNRAVTDLYEPGSPIKALTVAAALSSGKFQPNTPVDTSPGWMRMNGRTIRDVGNYGLLDVSGVVVKSSNIGTSRIALALSGDTLYQTLSQLGFGKASGIQFPGEAIGTLPYHPKWRPIQVATMSYGYGLSGTSVQLARAYAILADRKSTRLNSSHVKISYAV